MMNRIRIHVPLGAGAEECTGCADMWVSVAHHPLPTFVTVTGDIDGSNVDRLRACLRQAISRGGALVVDLSDVEFLSVAACRELQSVGEECAQVGVDWVLVISEAVDLLLRALVRVTGSDPRLPLARSRDQAMRQLTDPERSPLVVPPERTRC